jgi:CRP/FNR family cyclic AMP-dependent transcriptional regulator
MKSPQQSVAALEPFLRRVPLFSDLSPRALDVLARVSRVLRVPRGHVIFQRGGAGTAAYVVESGTIVISIAMPDGRELVVNELHAGDCFGELALLTGRARSATAIASTPSELLLVPRAEFLDELEREPRIMRHLLESVSGKLADSVQLESELAFLDVPRRLARTLLLLEREQDMPGVIRSSLLPREQKELGEMDTEKEKQDIEAIVEAKVRGEKVDVPAVKEADENAELDRRDSKSIVWGDINGPMGG